MFDVGAAIATPLDSASASKVSSCFTVLFHLLRDFRPSMTYLFSQAARTKFDHAAHTRTLEEWIDRHAETLPVIHQLNF
jgi:hypothetical protein